MADYLPQATGNWSTTTWITAFSNLTAFAGGNLPPASIDDVYTDGKSITIDTNIFVNSLRTTTSPRTGGLAGGGFFINNNVSLTANSVIPGTTNCLTFLSATPNSCTVTGNISGSATTANAYGLLNNSSGTLNLRGSILGGSVTNGTASFNNSTGTINVVGNITGGSGLDSRGLRNASSGTIAVTGSVVGGAGNSSASDSAGAAGIHNVLSGPVTIVGSVSGGTNAASYGLMNSATGTVNITGNIIGPPIVTNGGTGLYMANASVGTVTVYGNVFASAAGQTYGILNNSNSATLNVFGNVFGGNHEAIRLGGVSGSINIVGNLSGSNVASQVVVNNQGSGTISITGNVVGGGAASSHGCVHGGQGLVTIFGNVSGGTGGGAFGINNTSVGRMFVFGNVTGGPGATTHGANNNSTGSIFIQGTALAGTGNLAYGANNNSTGLLSATKVVANAFGLGSVGLTLNFGLANTQNGRAYVEQVEFGPRGATPISGPVYILPSNRNTLTGRLTALGNTVTFYNSLSVDGLLPPVSSVQAGVVYNVGNSVGTMAVPSASAVQFGVAVDNTVGTAALQPQDVWGYARLSATQVDSMGDRLRNTATTQSIGYQIASFNL